MNCSKCQKSFSSTPEFINHVEQHHGTSTLRFGTKCYTRDPTDYLFHCNFSGCKQVLVHRQDFQNHIWRQHHSGKENKHPGPSSNAASLAVRTPRKGQLMRQDSSPYSRPTREGACGRMVSTEGNMAQKGPLNFFSVFNTCRTGREGPRNNGDWYLPKCVDQCYPNGWLTYGDRFSRYFKFIKDVQESPCWQCVLETGSCSISYNAHS